MMMSDIPADLIEEILSRVPAASLKRLRSTCKRWNDLFKDERFKEKHFRKAPKQSRILTLDNYRICSLNANLNVSPPAIEFKGPLGALQQVDIEEVFHCDGLLLCSTKDANKIIIWNPCLGETKWIETTTDNEKFDYCSFALGYTNNKSCRSYKILKCWNRLDHMEGFEVYELSSDSWRVSYELPLDCCILPPSCGVSFKGNAYWLAWRTTNQILLGFDFTRDSFRDFSLPPLEYIEDIYLSTVREEKLSLLRWPHHASHMEVWVTHDIDTQAALWSKSFSVELSNPPRHSYVSFVSFLFDEKKIIALCLNPGLWNSKLYIVGEDNEDYRLFPSAPYKKRTMCPFFFSYVPSLVRVQQSGRR